MKLAGKVALVTGANRGIGAALVSALLARDAAKVYAGGPQGSFSAATTVEPGH